MDVAPRFSGAVALEWLPSDDQLLTAFHKSGYQSPGAAGSIPVAALVAGLRVWPSHTASYSSAPPYHCITILMYSAVLGLQGV